MMSSSCPPSASQLPLEAVMSVFTANKETIIRLEAENKILRKYVERIREENEKLKNENQQLTRENDELKRKLESSGLSGISNGASSCHPVRNKFHFSSNNGIDDGTNASSTNELTSTSSSSVEEAYKSKLFESTRFQIRTILASNPNNNNGISKSRLQNIYLKKTGRALPIRELGFPSNTAFLKSLTDFIRFQDGSPDGKQDARIYLLTEREKEEMLERDLERVKERERERQMDEFYKQNAEPPPGAVIEDPTRAATASKETLVRNPIEDIKDPDEKWDKQRLLLETKLEIESIVKENEFGIKTTMFTYKYFQAHNKIIPWQELGFDDLTHFFKFLCDVVIIKKQGEAQVEMLYHINTPYDVLNPRPPTPQPDKPPDAPPYLTESSYKRPFEKRLPWQDFYYCNYKLEFGGGEYCSFKAEKFFDLRAHRESTRHGGKFDCDFKRCDRKFISLDRLKAHKMDDYHADAKPFKKKFNSRDKSY